MFADRTPLEPEPAEPNRLQRPAREPDRREEVALEASDHAFAANGIAATPDGESSDDEQHHDRERDNERN